MAVFQERPYSGQNFLVDLGDGETQGPVAGFMEVSGLAMSLDVTEFRAGNSRESNPSKVTGLARTADVTLKRGIVGSLSLYKWFDAVRNGDNGLRTVTITLLGETGEPVMVWKLIRARPVKIAYGPLSACSDIAMEELVLAYERLEME